MMKKLLLTILIIFSSSAISLEVIYDSGDTRDISNYLYQFSGVDRAKEKALELRKIKNPRELSAELKKDMAEKAKAYKEIQNENIETDKKLSYNSSFLPLDTGGLVLGKVRTRSVSFPELKHPLCIIGSDSKSLKWFDRVKYYIKENGGQCWLIQAETVHDLKRVLRHSKGVVSVIPITGKLAIDRFGIDRYPVIIDHEEITQ